MRRCNRCVLPDTYPTLQLDDHGVCTQCKAFVPATSLGPARLVEAVQPFRAASGPECLVALSGGRDSTYVLNYVTKELGLRALAVSIDNGFLPEGTFRNVDAVVQRTQCEHVWIRDYAIKANLGPFLRAWKGRPTAAMIAFICSGCQGVVKRALIDVARSRQIRLVIGGGGDLVGRGGEPEQSFAESLLRVWPGVLGKRLSMAWGAFLQIAANPRFWVRPRLLAAFWGDALGRFVLRYPNDLTVLGLFEYIRWEEEEILRTIVEQCGWEKPAGWPTTWRSDCMVHMVKQYMYDRTLGFTKNEELLSGMIREGQLQREPALVRLRKENEQPMEMLGDFLAQYGVKLSDMEAALGKTR